MAGAWQAHTRVRDRTHVFETEAARSPKERAPGSEARKEREKGEEGEEGEGCKAAVHTPPRGPASALSSACSLSRSLARVGECRMEEERGGGRGVDLARKARRCCTASSATRIPSPSTPAAAYTSFNAPTHCPTHTHTHTLRVTCAGDSAHVTEPRELLAGPRSQAARAHRGHVLAQHRSRAHTPRSASSDAVQPARLRTPPAPHVRRPRALWRRGGGEKGGRRTGSAVKVV
eukprot:1705323-Rhodomonas_salina.1